MTQPLALVVYEKLLPGSQLVNRLQDLQYRVQTLGDASKLTECAEQERPMLVLVDLECTKANVFDAIKRLRQTPNTQHLPVIGILSDKAISLQESALSAGVTLVVNDVAILNHLPQFLDQALQVD
jgi:PleD family two-component response regulator